MSDPDAPDVRSTRSTFSRWASRIALRPWFVTCFTAVLLAISLTTGRLAYLLMAVAVLSVTVLLSSSAFAAGVLWILAISTVTGFYQRLILYRSGQSPSPDFVRLALEVSVLLYTALAAISWLRRSRTIATLRAKWLDLIVGLYLLVTTLYAFNLIYVEPLITLYGWRWVCIPVCMYYLGRAIGSRPDMLSGINKYIIVLLLVQAGYGAYQAIGGYPSFEQPWISQRAAAQSYAAVEDSMFIAGRARIPALTEGHTSSGFLIPILFLWTAFMSDSAFPRRWHTLRRLAMVVGLLFLVFANERSAVGMVGLGIGVVVFLRARKGLGRTVFLVAVPASVLLFLLVSQIDPSTIPWREDTIVLRRMLELLNPLKSGTLAGRMNVYWPAYWRSFLENPLGYGLGSFHATSATRSSSWGRSPHNMYLQVLLETGVFGLFSLLAVLAVYTEALYRSSRRCLGKSITGLVLSAFSSQIAFLAIGVANQPIETFPLALHFWFLMGFVTSCLTRAIDESGRDSSKLAASPIEVSPI